MKIRGSLYAKILLWLCLNLALLAAVFYVFFRLQYRVGLDYLVGGRAGDRIQSVAELITKELEDTPREEWDELLERFSNAYKVQVLLFRPDGTQIAGEPMELPQMVLHRLLEGRPQRPPQARRRAPFGNGPDGPPVLREEPPGNPFREGRSERVPGRRPGGLMPRPPMPKFMLRTADPTRYWVGVRIPVIDEEGRPNAPATLLAMSPSMRGGGLFFDLTPWLEVGAAVLVISVLFWFPLVRGMTRSIRRMTTATEEIASGNFDARVQGARRDELGRLSQAINAMASRLAGFVSGQKRFLGDIAHELCSPIARIQVALGILEERADEKQKAYVEDLREEVEQMSALVNELLSFSKAGLRQREIQLVPVNVSEIIHRAVDREAAASAPVQMDTEPDLQALAEPELLTRALANLVRNALRYAGTAGPVTVSARTHGEEVLVTVADSGPGLPEDALAKIFDPFFRPEASRSRETGGVGLGLAIVKTCIEACDGRVTVANRQPCGLQVDLVLRRA